MTSLWQPPRPVLVLIERACNETLTQAEHEQLEQRLLADEALRQFYLEYWTLHAELQTVVVMDLAVQQVRQRVMGEEPAAVLPEPSSLAEPWQRRTGPGLPGVVRRGLALLGQPLPFSVFVATVAMISLILTSAQIRVAEDAETPPRAAPPMGAAPVVARLTQSVPPHPVGLTDSTRQLRAGQVLRLEQGLAELTFARGTKVLLAGPSRFTVTSASGGFLETGSLTALVPPAARGFVIETPQASIIDQGTEFAVEIGPQENLQVHVFQGAVDLVSRASAGPPTRERIAAGASICYARQGILWKRPARPAQFVRVHQLPQRSEEQYIPNPAWPALRARLRQEAELAFSFDSHSGALPDVLPNAAANGPPVTAHLKGVTGTAGRWPGKQAAGFSHPADRIQLGDLQGSFDALTLTAWVRFASLGGHYDSLFACDNWNLPGQFAWQRHPHGNLRFAVHGDEEFLSTTPRLQPELHVGRWLHLAVVYDGSQQRITHYVNGKRFGQSRLDSPQPLRLRSACFGNWQNGTMPLGRHGPRQLNGALDDLFLIGRALSSQEVRELYEGSKPLPAASLP